MSAPKGATVPLPTKLESYGRDVTAGELAIVLGTVLCSLGFAALIVGSALGGPFIAWLGMGRALWVSGLLMMFSNFMFAILATIGHSPLMLGLAVGTENLTSGIRLTVFVTYLSGLSNLAYTATQFALLSKWGQFTQFQPSRDQVKIGIAVVGYEIDQGREHRAGIQPAIL